MPFTDLDRQAGRKAMEESLTPLTRALRKFSAGRPSARLMETPLGAVYLVVEQRDRLKNILAEEDGLKRPKITGAAILVRLKIKGSTTLENEIVEVEDGKESAAVRELEKYIAFGHKFTTSGLMFGVHAGNEERVFTYRVERTTEGDAALKLAGARFLRPKRQHKG